MEKIVKLILLFEFLWGACCWAIEYPGNPHPGPASVQTNGNQVTLQNSVIAFTFEVNGGQIQNAQIDDKTQVGETQVQLNEPFILKIGTIDVRDSNLNISGSAQTSRITGDPNAMRLGERFDSWQAKVTYMAPDSSYQVDWKAILRDGSNYILLETTVEALTANVDLARLTLIDATADSPQTVGSATGSPVVAERYFLGYHYPTAIYSINGSNIIAYWDRANSLISQGDKITMTAAVGIFPQNQRRRSFHYYLNRERMQPYYHFLHYNSWYDVAHSNRAKKFDEAECLDRIQKFGQELKTERGVTLQTYAWDDPWDNISGTATDVWQFDLIRHPNQWQNMKTATETQGATNGAWMSPRGGYGADQTERINTATRNGLPYDTSGGIFKLSDTPYYARYRDVALDMLNNQGVGYFKFDGFTSGQDAERERLFGLILELRSIQPDLFVNTTIGSWASPYFLMYSDSIWRQGGDIGTTGSGTTRQQWINYRDGQTYNNIIQPNPLYPLNSLMLHGIVLASYAHIAGLRTTTAEEFKQEVRSYFATGVNLQELYIGPDNPDTGDPIMTEELWDILAEAAQWAKSNEDVFCDSHWMGGNPNNGDIYGTASWNQDKAILMLRNPSNLAKPITLDPKDIFELPDIATTKVFVMKSPWTEDQNSSPVILRAGTPHQFDLDPFEVLVLQACRGDLDGNCVINLKDFAVFANHWLECMVIPGC